MEFNPSKCQVLHIARSRKPIHRNYTMHGQVLESVDHARYLGVDISSDLNFSHHINRITANASKSLGFLKSNIKTKHSGIRESAHKTVVRPQLEYASPIWSPFTKQTSIKWKRCRGEPSVGPSMHIHLTKVSLNYSNN